MARMGGDGGVSQDGALRPRGGLRDFAGGAKTLTLAISQGEIG
jgi:hypothetical protein